MRQSSTKRPPKTSLTRLEHWKLEDAKARPQQKTGPSMFELLRSLSIGDLDLTRERDTGW